MEAGIRLVCVEDDEDKADEGDENVSDGEDEGIRLGVDVGEVITFD